MSDVVTTLGPLLLFMLIPLWIPVIAIGVGHLYDFATRGRAPRGWQRRQLSADVEAAGT